MAASIHSQEILNVEPESASSLRVDEEEGNLDYVSAASGLVKFDELLNSMLIRQRPKRALWTVGLDISPGLTIGVKGFVFCPKQDLDRKQGCFLAYSEF